MFHHLAQQLGQSANFPSVQAESGRGRKYQNQPNPAIRGDAPPCTGSRDTTLFHSLRCRKLRDVRDQEQAGLVSCRVDNDLPASSTDFGYLEKSNFSEDVEDAAL